MTLQVPDAAEDVIARWHRIVAFTVIVRPLRAIALIHERMAAMLRSRG